MTEFSGAGGVVINGREQNGRTYRRDDGTYESLDLKDVKPDEMVTVLTSDGIQELVKAEGEAHDSALENWRLGPKVVRIVLGESAGNGATFIHYGIVLRERLQLQVGYPESNHPNVVHSLGAIASIVSLRSAEVSGGREMADLKN